MSRAPLCPPGLALHTDQNQTMGLSSAALAGRAEAPGLLQTPGGLCCLLLLSWRCQHSPLPRNLVELHAVSLPLLLPPLPRDQDITSPCCGGTNTSQASRARAVTCPSVLDTGEATAQPLGQFWNKLGKVWSTN